MKIRLNKAKPKPVKKRKEVYLDPEVISILKMKAKYTSRSLKNYMEQVLIRDSEENIATL